MQQQVNKRDRVLTTRPLDPKGYSNFDDGRYEKKYEYFDQRSPQHVEFCDHRSTSSLQAGVNTNQWNTLQNFIYKLLLDSTESGTHRFLEERGHNLSLL